MRVRATFRRSGDDDYTIEGTLTGSATGALDIGCNYVRYADGYPEPTVVAVEVLTPKFEIGAWYEHPDKPGWLWRRYNGYFQCLDFLDGSRRHDVERAHDGWRAGLRRVTLPSEQQEQA